MKLIDEVSGEMIELQTWQIVVAFATPLVAAATFLWQLCSFMLDKPKLKVDFSPRILLKHSERFLIHDAVNWPLERSGSYFDISNLIESALVSVENKSKHPVAIMALGVQVRHRSHSAKRWIYKYDKVVIGEQYMYARESPVDDGMVRLGPFDASAISYDLWNTISVLRGRASVKVIELKGFARVAGKRRAFVSKRKFRWEIESGLVTGLGWYLKVPFSHLVLREMNALLTLEQIVEYTDQLSCRKIAEIVENCFDDSNDDNESLHYRMPVQIKYALAYSSKLWTHSEKLEAFSSRLSWSWINNQEQFTIPSEDPNDTGLVRS